MTARCAQNRALSSPVFHSRQAHNHSHHSESGFWMEVEEDRASQGQSKETSLCDRASTVCREGRQL
jgi:hypothetical protein